MKSTKINKGTFYLGDCLEVMNIIEDKSIDMVLCDLPYGTTACKWDTIIPFEPLWKEYKRIIKDNGAIVLFGSEPFSSYLRLSNIKMFKYDWIWEKNKSNSFLLAKKMPMKYHENILVFYHNSPIYNPQKTTVPKEKIIKRIKIAKSPVQNNSVFGDTKLVGSPKIDDGTRYPSTVIKCSTHDKNNSVHPTQKPVALFEYLIKTYTNENDLVLDNCLGSGTTGIACANLNRRCIGIELDETYYNQAMTRIKEQTQQQSFI